MNKLMPVQDFGLIPEEVYMRAYGVYSYVYGPQKALLENGCRGGFGICEMFAFLYAYPFPKEQWRQKVEEVFNNHKKVRRAHI